MGTRSSNDYVFTSESVTKGHPDKICDQVSDAIVDATLRQDPSSRVAVETCIKKNIYLIGELTTRANIDFNALARRVVRSIGYDGGTSGFNPETCKVVMDVNAQSPDIAMGVDRGDKKTQGAGDQGLMFGYASNETPEYMPLSHALAQKLTRKLAELRESGALPYLRPDGKSQVTVRYDKDGIPLSVDAVVISTQHKESIKQAQIHHDMRTALIDVICREWLTDETVYHVNPTGNFVTGGPEGDSGVTGRKIIVDTYGGAGRHGGGAFSGKDPSKVDRSGAYMGRYVAKNVVAAGLADRCEIQIAYAIGVADPVSVRVETFGTAKVPEAAIARAIQDTFDLRPGSIIEALDLLQPKPYQELAANGHMGRLDMDVSWEKIDKIGALNSAVR